MRMGNLQIVEEEGNIQGRKILATQFRNNDTHARVKILKVIKPELPS